MKYADALLSDNEFLNNSADAVDLDYASGTVTSSLFDGNGNDGIDISGSTVLISDNYILKSGDKCISIGEKSEEPIIFNNVLDGCNIGIETKDASTPIIANTVIINNNLGLNAYRKKEIFEVGGLPKVYNTIIWDNEGHIIDDEFSDTKIYHSNIEGEFKGEGNITVEPGISERNTHKVTSNEKLQSAGILPDTLKDVIGLDEDSVPIGLLRDVRVK